jgi:hypothetical protein
VWKGFLGQISCIVYCEQRQHARAQHRQVFDPKCPRTGCLVAPIGEHQHQRKVEHPYLSQIYWAAVLTSSLLTRSDVFASVGYSSSIILQSGYLRRRVAFVHYRYVGYATPVRAGAVISFVAGVTNDCSVKVGIDWHGYRNRSLTVINAITALKASATRSHGTALGIGERVAIPHSTSSCEPRGRGARAGSEGTGLPRPSRLRPWEALLSWHPASGKSAPGYPIPP